MASDIIVDVLVEKESPEVNVEVANRAGGLKSVLHDETLLGDGVKEPLGVNPNVIPDVSGFATKDDVADKADKSEIPDAYDDTEIRTKLDEVEGVADNAKAIAEGKATGYVFDTVDDMNTWLETNSSILKLGDNLYIRAVDVPDYWWDGEKAQQLETQKVDLSSYLPLSGGTLSGELGVPKLLPVGNADIGGANEFFNNIFLKGAIGVAKNTNGMFLLQMLELPKSGGTIARVEDITAAVGDIESALSEV